MVGVCTEEKGNQQPDDEACGFPFQTWGYNICHFFGCVISVLEVGSEAPLPPALAGESRGAAIRYLSINIFPVAVNLPATRV